VTEHGDQPAVVEPAAAPGPEPPASPRYVRPRVIADVLDISVDTVYSLAQRGEIPVAFRVGPELRFSVEEVVTALKRATAEGS
jgi:excisionase family DNA binding protein